MGKTEGLFLCEQELNIRQSWMIVERSRKELKGEAVWMNYRAVMTLVFVDDQISFFHLRHHVVSVLSLRTADLDLKGHLVSVLGPQ